ncbi:MAG: hypothetical protein AAF270_10275 [Pseudomonadota bacterium]
MTESTRMNEEERVLQPFIAAVRDTAEHADISAAAARLRAKLPNETTAAPSRGWVPRFATMAAVVAVVATSLPFMLPGGAGTAFANVQAWFASYDTLEVRTSMTFGDQVMMDMRVRTTARGDVRIEQAGATQIINAETQTFTMLLPEQRYTRQPIAVAAARNQGLEWVEELAAFRGDAVRLDAPRTISGVAAIGHRLVIDGVDLTLWSRADNDQPLLLEGDLPGGLSMRTQFDFDVPMPLSLFDIPAGYSPL